MSVLAPYFPEKIGTVQEVLSDLVDEQAQSHLILIHGIADSPDVWRGVCRKLDFRFKSYQELSLPWSCGVGDPISYEPSPEEVLEKVWDQLPEGPKVVLAHSFGANTFVSMAQRRHLDDVAALVIASIYYKPSYSDFTWPLFIQYVNEFDRFLSMSLNARQGSKTLSEKSKNLIVEKTMEMYNPPSWVQFFILWSSTPGLNLDKLTMPTLVIGGSDDFSIDKQDIAAFANRLPDSEFHYLNPCGHFPMLETTQETATIIHNFLNKRIQICQ